MQDAGGADGDGDGAENVDRGPPWAVCVQREDPGAADGDGAAELCGGETSRKRWVRMGALEQDAGGADGDGDGAENVDRGPPWAVCVQREDPGAADGDGAAELCGGETSRKRWVRMGALEQDAGGADGDGDGAENVDRGPPWAVCVQREDPGAADGDGAAELCGGETSRKRWVRMGALEQDAGGADGDGDGAENVDRGPPWAVCVQREDPGAADGDGAAELCGGETSRKRWVRMGALEVCTFK
ncbi:unnamed protein product [Camellia sinensis]